VKVVFHFVQAPGNLSLLRIKVKECIALNATKVHLYGKLCLASYRTTKKAIIPVLLDNYGVLVLRGSEPTTYPRAFTNYDHVRCHTSEYNVLKSMN
jgi:hypothetical protein